MKIQANNLSAETLCKQIQTVTQSLTIDGVNGQRYLAAGMTGKDITLNGTPGNALGAYLDGAKITVNGNAQDATGDTMNDGAIIVHGSCGDATGYAMRGGKIYVEGNVGYRAGIHMKAYHEKQPLLIIGGQAGSFLGEYQAGGTIVVLGLHSEGKLPVGQFAGTGMHGGKILLRCDSMPQNMPPQVCVRQATEKDFAAVEKDLQEYCQLFGLDVKTVLQHHYFVLEANTKNPYQQMYCYS